MPTRSLAIAYLAIFPLAAQPLIDNARVRVLKVTSPPRKPGRMHKHDVNRVMVYLDAGQMTLTDPEGKVRHVRWRAGEALWDPAGGLHVAENVGDKPFRVVEIELKGKGGRASYPPLDPLTVEPERYRLEFENDQVRVFRARFEPRAKVALHEHVLERVMVLLTDQNIKVTTPEGREDLARGVAGEVKTGGAAKHREENLSDQRFEVLVVELKP